MRNRIVRAAVLAVMIVGFVLAARPAAAAPPGRIYSPGFIAMLRAALCRITPQYCGR